MQGPFHGYCSSCVILDDFSEEMRRQSENRKEPWFPPTYSLPAIWRTHAVIMKMLEMVIISATEMSFTELLVACGLSTALTADF